MKVLLTKQSLKRLEEALLFYGDELRLPTNSIIKIKKRLLEKVKSLSKNPY